MPVDHNLTCRGGINFNFPGLLKGDHKGFNLVRVFRIYNEHKGVLVIQNRITLEVYAKLLRVDGIDVIQEHIPLQWIFRRTGFWTVLVFYKIE